jgi:hypothetical protein
MPGVRAHMPLTGRDAPRQSRLLLVRKGRNASEGRRGRRFPRPPGGQACMRTNWSNYGSLLHVTPANSALMIFSKLEAGWRSCTPTIFINGIVLVRAVHEFGGVLVHRTTSSTIAPLLACAFGGFPSILRMELYKRAKPVHLVRIA